MLRMATQIEMLNKPKLSNLILGSFHKFYNFINIAPYRFAYILQHLYIILKKNFWNIYCSKYHVKEHNTPYYIGTHLYIIYTS